MGKEVEIKLSAPDAATLERVCSDASVEAARCGPWQQIRMETTYLDTADGAFAARKWTLRRRLENGEAVYTIKTAGEGYERGEWESRKTDFQEALGELLRSGAPQDAALYAARGVAAHCGVVFLRRTAHLRCRSGAEFWICVDSGQFLAGEQRRQDFFEVELELISGAEAQMLAFARDLQARHALLEERRSKFLRAAELAR